MEGLIFGGAYIQRGICLEENLRLKMDLDYILKEIYVSNLHKAFTETYREDVVVTISFTFRLRVSLNL